MTTDIVLIPTNPFCMSRIVIILVCVGAVVYVSKDCDEPITAYSLVIYLLEGTRLT